MNTELRHVELTSNSKDLDKFCQLYEEAFPESERPGTFMELINAFDKDDSGHVIGTYDGEAIAGFQAYQKYDNFIFLMFFAVNAKIRGKGYGSKLLQYLKDTYPNLCIIGCIETLDEKAENNDQRIARKRFYERNGLFTTDYSYTLPGQQFTIICSHDQEEAGQHIFEVIGSVIDTLRKGQDYYMESVARFY